MTERERAVAWDAEFWIDSPLSGSAGYVSSDKADDPPVILVPDGQGGYREHPVAPKPQGRMGF